jgi:peptide deformylase
VGHLVGPSPVPRGRARSPRLDPMPDRSERENQAPGDAEAPVTPQGPSSDAGLDLDPEARERRRAALAQVRQFGDPVLRSPASPVTEFDDRLRADAERMVDLMHDAMGVGLAATQLGTMRRLLVFQAGPDAPPTPLVNPEIEWSSDEAATAEEGCLSLPGVIVDVERPLHVRVTAQDTDGAALTIEASGLEARVIQHELDHLDGVLMIERTTREQRKGALSALREGTSFSPEREAEPAPAEA